MLPGFDDAVSTVWQEVLIFHEINCRALGKY